MHKILIDRFTIPNNAQEEFSKQMAINRNFLRHLPGFIRDAVYFSKAQDESIHIVTFAEWENQKSIDEAKEAVSMENRKRGFDREAMLDSYGIIMERGIFEAGENYETT